MLSWQKHPPLNGGCFHACAYRLGCGVITDVKLRLLLVVFVAVFVSGSIKVDSVSAQAASQSGSVGLQGTVTAPAPTTAPIISIPKSGGSIVASPTTISGICDSDLLVKVFKNGVFGGSVQCQNGSFSMSMDLFNGRNDLIAKQYDLLDQESPSSAVVSVLYSDNIPNETSVQRITLTTNFAKKGANPGEKLIWPFAISGGAGPYAITAEWGDGENSLLSIANPGEFSIDHTYKNPGSYTVVVKAVDSTGKTALIQVVAISNGKLSQAGAGSGKDSTTTSQTKTRILWQPAAIMIPFIMSTFWLGKRYAIYRLRKKIEAGERPFNY